MFVSCSEQFLTQECDGMMGFHQWQSEHRVYESEVQINKVGLLVGLAMPL
jgi:hypothetical protein